MKSNGIKNKKGTEWKWKMDGAELIFEEGKKSRTSCFYHIVHNDIFYVKNKLCEIIIV